MMGKLAVYLFLLMAWLPWNKGGVDKLNEAVIEQMMPPDCPGRGSFYMPNRIMVCTTTRPASRKMVLLHESQHYLLYRHDIRMIKFIPTAMTTLKDQDLSREQWIQIRKRLRLGPWDLHAQLPWILKGQIPSDLQSYYPWFDLETKESW